jgi:hypothetical protein
VWLLLLLLMLQLVVMLALLLRSMVKLVLLLSSNEQRRAASRGGEEAAANLLAAPTRQPCCGPIAPPSLLMRVHARRPAAAGSDSAMLQTPLRDYIYVASTRSWGLLAPRRTRGAPFFSGLERGFSCVYVRPWIADRTYGAVCIKLFKNTSLVSELDGLCGWIQPSFFWMGSYERSCFSNVNLVCFELSLFYKIKTIAFEKHQSIHISIKRPSSFWFLHTPG